MRKLLPTLTISSLTTIVKIDIRPKERFVTPLSESLAFDFDADQVSDKKLVDLLILGLADENTNEDAAEVLSDMAVGGIRRDISGTSANDGVYHPYTMRSAGMHDLQLYIVPGQPLGSGNVAGDFAFTTDSTMVPVSTLTVAVVSRTNPNATARAYVQFGRIQMRLLNGIVLKD